MTELWSDDDDKTQLAEGMDDSYKRITAYRGDAISRMTMQDRDPYAYLPQYASSGSSPNSNLNAGVDDDTAVFYPQRSSARPTPHPTAPGLVPRHHPHVPPDATALRSPPLPRPEKSTTRRSRALAWEMVSTDQDDPQEYYIGSPGGAVVRKRPNSSLIKSNLHPILQNFSSPISVYLFDGPPTAILILVYRRVRRSA